MNRRTLSEGTGRLAWSLLLVCGSGCALFSKGTPLPARYFSPVLSAVGQSPASQAAPPELRLGHVEAATHLEQRIAYRASESELGYYDSWRWTEPPEAYLERALSEQLFERDGLVHVMTGAAPTLDAELLAFEEIRTGTPRARVEIRMALRDERRSLLERTVRIERPVAAGPAEDAPVRLTKALSLALADGVAQLSQLLKGQLGQRP